MKIDVTILKKARQEHTHERNLLVATLKEQIIGSVNSYLADISKHIPAGAENLAICLKAFYIKENILYVDIDKDFFSNSVVNLAQYNSKDYISLCSVEGAVLSVPENLYESVLAYMPEECIRTTGDTEYSLYYPEIIGGIPFSEIWEEELLDSYCIPLT